jgi:hypothetical protein
MHHYTDQVYQKGFLPKITYLRRFALCCSSILIFHSVSAFAQSGLPNLSPSRTLSFNQWRDATCFSNRVAEIAAPMLVSESEDDNTRKLGSNFYSNALGTTIRPKIVTMDDIDINVAAPVNATWLGMRVTGVGRRGGRFPNYTVDYLYLRTNVSVARQSMRRANVPIETDRVGASYEIEALPTGIVKISCYEHAGISGYRD